MVSTTNSGNDYPFLQGGGEMGDRIRSFDWQSTSIGSPEVWPQSLCTTLSIMLSSKFPMFLWWGDELVQFYNDAYRPSFGNDGKHPQALGQCAEESWPEIWQTISPLIQQVRTTGEATWSENQLIPIYRNGKIENVYWTFGYSAVKNDLGEIQGVLVICNETTANVENLRQVAESENKFRSLIEQAPVATCLFTGPDFIVEIANEKMLRFFGDRDILGKPVLEALPELEKDGFGNLLKEVYETGVPIQKNAVKSELVINHVLKRFYFDFTYKPLFDKNGNVYGVINMAVNVTDRVESDNHINEIQRQLLDSFEQSPVGIAIINGNDLVFATANAFYGKLVGREPKDIINKTLFEALPEIEGQGFDALLREVMRTGIPYVAKEIPVELLRNGQLETIYVDLAYQPKYDSGNDPAGVLVVATDVTQQVISRREVEASEARLKALIAGAPAGIGLFVGRDLIIESPNQTFIDIVGKGWDIVGKPLREAMPELITEGQPFLKILDDVYTTGVAFTSPGVQVKIVQNGVMTYNYYNIIYQPFRNEDGEIYAILDIALDVTETVNAIKKANEAEESLKGAVELAELAMWKLDVKENTFWYSPRFMDWLGTGKDHEHETKAFDFIPDDSKDFIRQKIEQALLPTGNGLYEAEHPIINSITGQRRIIHAQAQVFYDVNGNPEFLTGTAQDVTVERQLKEELEQLVNERTEKLRQANADLQKSNAELEQFAYIASHDLQEPLRKISTFIKMLDHQLPQKDDKAKHYIDRIVASSERMRILISDVLGFSRLSGSRDVFEKTDLNAVFDSIVTDFELIVEQQGAQIKSERLPVIEAVPLQLEQLFHNLISNALKYSRQDVPARVSITSAAATKDEIVQHDLDASVKYHRLEFRDNGIGFSQQYAEQIFQIFQRLHGKTDYAGTGIGLAMCRKIAQNHHGAIYANSQGNGAVFTVLLPEKQNDLN